MRPIETVGIISKPGIDHASEIVSGLLAWLGERGIKARAAESNVPSPPSTISNCVPLGTSSRDRPSSSPA